MKHLYIRLIGGRVSENEPRYDLGFDGPLIGPLDRVFTSGGVTRVRFLTDQIRINPIAMRNALAFGFSESDAVNVTLTEVPGQQFVHFEGFFFEGWAAEVIDDKAASQENKVWFKETKLKQLSRQAQFLRANGN